MIVLFLWVRPLCHVTQRRTNDCAIATAAIVARVPYETAARHSPVQPGKRGLRLWEIRGLLESATGFRWQYPQRAWFQNVARFAAADDFLVLGIREPWKWWVRHLIAIKDGWVYDPAYPAACPMQHYARSNWPVIATYRPGRESTAQWVRDRLALLACGVAVQLVPCTLAFWLAGK